MKTESQLKTEVYTAISSIAATYWSQSIKNKSLPFINYYLIDNLGEYSMGITREAESTIFQIDLYYSPKKQLSLDTAVELLKIAMENIGYRLTNAPEFQNLELNAVVRTTRWERYNA